MSYSTSFDNVSTVTQQSTQITYNYYYNFLYNDIKKSISIITQSQINTSKEIIEYLDENNVYSNNTNYYINLNYDKTNWLFTTPIEYSSDFYINFTQITLPLNQSEENVKYGNKFYSLLPYSKVLTTPLNNVNSLSLNSNNQQVLIILKDVYIPNNIYDQRLLIPPLDYTGQVGYKIYINKHEILYNKISYNYPELLFDNTNYLTDIPSDIYDNPKNYYYLLTPGRNRIIIEFIYDKQTFQALYPLQVFNTIIYPPIQFDLIINDRRYINSGLYLNNFKYKSKYIKLNNLQLAVINDNNVWTMRQR